ncbi:MAG: FliI/YscN family ATPase [Gammaproteobacteria bacterium]|nr:FliI/YscN family ATPase [Gammaproteobacteria bacterium]
MADGQHWLEQRVFERAARWSGTLAAVREQASASSGFVVNGVLSRMLGIALEARGCEAVVGSRCLLSGHDGRITEAEVVGFADDSLLLMPTDHLHGLMPGARVMPTSQVFEARVGPDVLGRVLDGAGRPLDALGPLASEHRIRLVPKTINPLRRELITKPLDVGVRSINALLTVGRGQRLGLFARSGVGKSMLLGMMTKFTGADVIVVGLVGERGREVQEFVSRTLDAESRRRAVVVATPADYPPLMRVHGALLATAIAEYFRDQGRQVLLLIDSLTRVAQAQREIALATGEPPVTKGFPVSVFAKIPELVERAGTVGSHGGSITAFYTVLTEGDDRNDPIADAARAVLDGHIVLSPELAEAGIYPAIDLTSSISRAAQSITTTAQQALVQRFRRLHASYEQNKDLIAVGAYTSGQDPVLDEAIRYRRQMIEFLQQRVEQPIGIEQSFSELATLFSSQSGTAPPATTAPTQAGKPMAPAEPNR